MGLPTCHPEIHSGGGGEWRGGESQGYHFYLPFFISTLLPGRPGRPCLGTTLPATTCTHTPPPPHPTPTLENYRRATPATQEQILPTAPHYCLPPPPPPHTHTYRRPPPLAYHLPYLPTPTTPPPPPPDRPTGTGLEMGAFLHCIPDPTIPRPGGLPATTHTARPHLPAATAPFAWVGLGGPVHCREVGDTPPPPAPPHLPHLGDLGG